MPLRLCGLLWYFCACVAGEADDRKSVMHCISEDLCRQRAKNARRSGTFAMASAHGEHRYDDTIIVMFAIVYYRHMCFLVCFVVVGIRCSCSHILYFLHCLFLSRVLMADILDTYVHTSLPCAYTPP